VSITILVVGVVLYVGAYHHGHINMLSCIGLGWCDLLLVYHSLGCILLLIYLLVVNVGEDL
jgi:hypothetical protein